MKKTYIAPELTEFKVASQQLMADSPLRLTETGGTGKPLDEEAEGPALVRHRSIWDIDEED